jgi:hypothetical protein
MPELNTRLESNMFTLYVQRLNTVYDNFEKKLEDHIRVRSAMGYSRQDILSELQADLDGGQAVFGDLLGQAQHETDFGLNAEYQVSSNELLNSDKVVWTLDPEAEHCDSCLAQASMGPRKMEDVPFPGFQPSVGESNCERYCKCTLEPAP